MTKIDEALAAVTDAATLFNVELIRTADAPISALDDVIGTLDRAISRVQVLIAMHPELTRNDDAPRGSIPAEELVEHADTLKALEEAFSLPTEPARIVLRASARNDGTIEDFVRSLLNGRHLIGQPSVIGWYDTEVGALADLIAAEFPRDQQQTDDTDDTDDEIEPDSEALRALRRRALGPREEEQ